MYGLAKAAVLDHAAEIEIGLGADEIVRGDGNRLDRPAQAWAPPALSEREEQG